MMTKTEYKILIAVLFMHMRTGVSIDCYQCASKDGDSRNRVCLDPYDPIENEGDMGSCGYLDTHCVKYKTISKLYDSGFITGEPKETVTLTRSCINRDGWGEFCQAIESDGAFLIRCFCKTDGCNGGLTFLPSFTVLFMACSFAIYFYQQVA
ncbi:hypothetical protein CHS0354_017127 [Potamilus streckersoni]|uniref:Protein sleepless n=1 Tax=Potamilus streckersoni TaxID=2493646 RepID=A0AAE0S2T1_9BIVA|nr:hypothetical protein CHS0354_017127 [Potamilus streckersoni]